MEGVVNNLHLVSPPRSTAADDEICSGHLPAGGRLHLPELASTGDGAFRRGGSRSGGVPGATPIVARVRPDSSGAGLSFRNHLPDRGQASSQVEARGGLQGGRGSGRVGLAPTTSWSPSGRAPCCSLRSSASRSRDAQFSSCTKSTVSPWMKSPPRSGFPDSRSTRGCGRPVGSWRARCGADVEAPSARSRALRIRCGGGDRLANQKAVNRLH